MENAELLKNISTSITIISVIVGLVISVMNFRAAKEKEAESRKIEAAKPFLQLRQTLYQEALKNAAILATKELHTEEENAAARKRFSELYWGELSLVEEAEIEKKMIAVAKAENIHKDPNPTQRSTYDLAHAMRESIANSWGIDKGKIVETNK